MADRPGTPGPAAAGSGRARVIEDRAFVHDPAMRHRTVEAMLTVHDADGQPLRDATVVVEQRSHDFLFGCIGFDLVPLANGDAVPAERGAQLAEQWLELFNAATLPFYWGDFEPVPGQPATERLLRAARWFADRGCAVKGHPLAWHTVTAPWLLDLTTEQVLEAQRGRIRREVADFRGVVDTWDVINEVVIMPVFDKEDNGITRLCRDLGRIDLVRQVFDEARGANPGATLLLNDFDLSSAYECLIEGCLEAGIRIDALGLQTHMHQGYWGEERTLEVVDRFARYGLPIHLTESTLLSGELMPPEVEDLNDHVVEQWPSTPEGEARQADELVRHYRTLLSHPAVEAVTYWGITDAGAWLGAPVGLVRADGTPKPSYDALRQLVKDEWWVAPTSLTTDGDGRVPVTGWRGEYELRVGAATAGFVLDPTGPDVRLALPHARG
jgi:GH35 family endo-1,4-beta-xylanase